MGLKGYMLWVMGQLVQSPTVEVSEVVVRRVVALQVAFEWQTLKPVFRLIGYRLWV
jgi:hypothetical protein